MTKKQHLKSEAAKPTSAVLSLRKRYFFIGVGVLALILASITAYSFVYAGRFAPYTRIAGVPVGGLDKEKAAEKLTQAKDEFVATPLTLRHDTSQWSVKPIDLGTNIDLQQALNQAWALEKDTPWYSQIGKLLSALFVHPTRTAELVTVSETGKQYLKENVLSKIETPYEETSLNFTPGNVTVVEGKPGQRLREEQFKKELYAAFADRAKTTVILELEPFQPQVTPDMAVTARDQAQALLAGSWQVPLGGGKDKTLTAEEFAQWLTTVVTETTPPALAVTIKKEEVEKKLQEWSKEIRQNPVNARIAQDGAGVKVVEEGSNGMDIAVPASLQAIENQVATATAASKRVVAVKIDTLGPVVRSDTLAQLGIKELIGTATTDFTGSPNNRKFNIGRGQRSLDRLLVENGTVFSTTGALGPVDESTGYLPELVIKGNRTVPEAGGGLCQVSTTLFRSVLNAGLPIVERTNHAYRVGYYERTVGPGLDATVYIPSPDFKWKNDTGHALYVQSYIKGNTITFELYGTKDGRTSAISAPQILEEYPVGAPIYVETDTLAKGVTQQIEKPHNGAKTRVEYRVTRDGKEIYKKVFISVYKAWPAQFLVGTKEEAAPAPTPTPIPVADPTPTIQ